MSIMQKIFGAVGQQAPVAQQANPLVQVVPASQLSANPDLPSANNPTVPSSTAAALASPLDQFSGMWDIDPNAPAAPEGLFSKVTQQSLQEAAKRNDFSKAVSPELLAAIAAGGDGAIAATLQAMNAMTQKSFGDSAFTTTKIVEQALAKQRTEFEASLPALIKSQNVSENLRNSNPIFSHPASAPVLDMFKAQALKKYPNASASEIQTMANSYLESFASAATPKKAVPVSQQKMDWSTFLD